MNQRAEITEIIQAIHSATTLKEQARHVAALDAFSRNAVMAAAQARSIETADMIVSETLRPVAVHERSTIETDWLGEISASASDMGQRVIAEAALWYGRVHASVKADPEEFGEQAKGIARRTASQYGADRDAAEQSFLEYVAFLHRREGASGLPQVQQLVDSQENPSQTPQPDDVFDNFAPPVHPINQGVTGTETSERAPLLQEIIGNGGSASAPSHHDETQQFAGPPPQTATPGQYVADHSSRVSKVVEPLFQPSVAISHTANLNDYAPGGRLHAALTKETASRRTAASVAYSGKICPDCAMKVANGEDTEGSRPMQDLDPGQHWVVGDEEDDDHFSSSPCDGCGDTLAGYRHSAHVLDSGAKKQARSGLPQVQQIVDSAENPDPTPLPQEVAFPWGLEEVSEPVDERSDHKAVRQAALAFLRGLSLQPTASLNEVQRLQVAAYHKHADQWSQSGPQSHGPGAANNPGTTAQPAPGSQSAGYSQGQSDWAADGQPTYADASSAVSPGVQGYSHGFGDAARTDPTAPGGATPGQLPPGAGGFGEYQTHAASRTASLQVEAQTFQVGDVVERDGQRRKITRITPAGAGATSHADGPTYHASFMDEDGNAKSGGHVVDIWSKSTSHPTHAWSKISSIQPQASLRVSASFVTPVEQADPDFVKGYKYASKWDPKKPLVRRVAEKVAFEAGLYAGISDNPANQAEWVARHHAAAERYEDPAFTDRIAMHESFTQRVAVALPSMRVQGSYLAAKEGTCAYPDCDKQGKQVWDYDSNEMSFLCGEHAGPQQKATARTAATSLDLDTVAPSTSALPSGQTPINGPGTTPPMAGGVDPARAGGPAPYNGAEPYGAPAVTNGTAAHGQPTAIATQPGSPVDAAALERLSPQQRTSMFRQAVQAGLAKQTSQTTKKDEAL